MEAFRQVDIQGCTDLQPTCTVVSGTAHAAAATAAVSQTAHAAAANISVCDSKDIAVRDSAVRGITGSGVLGSIRSSVRCSKV